MTLRAVFLDHASLDLGDLDLAGLREAAGDLTLHPHTDARDTIARIAGADVVLTNKVVLDAAAIATAPDLKLILVTATGTNNVDLDAARACGIVVCNCRGYGTASVAQHALLLMLALRTRFLAYQQDVRDGAWQRADMFCLMQRPIGELAGQTLGILGYGTLGRAVARLGEAFGMTVRIGQLPGRPPHPDSLPFDDLLGTADIVSLHCPLTDGTRHLIDAAALARMKPTALLINTARGGLVDEQALADALRAGRLGGAGVDVLSTEPPRDGNPLLAADIPNLIVTPHNAWASRQARQRLLDQTVENLRAFLAGAPTRRVP
ncbi:2-hydroxyacid dehydrogenase [Chiayiivirga flava]|uniref:Glycerate dehydrogenase n=1 Tax=Chiayiivirga flava TaxID=659595 RepID=A0A7W8D7B2_9GAMM|nr:2-hydroxyacid dehydrogenase [Chiayiivirga flava]MBB5209234.1 glycerate dehydrogenase [Chiayiivirga flava]